MSKWLKEMNDLDFLNRTRTFFLKLRKKHKVRENFVPIIDKAGTVSKNIDQTLKTGPSTMRNCISVATK